MADRRAERELDQLILDAAEIADLYPRLGVALEKDSGAGSGGCASSVVPSIPVNTDVLSVIQQLDRDIPAVDAATYRALNDGDTLTRTVRAAIKGIESRYVQLAARPELAPITRWYAAKVDYWLYEIRVAIGLQKQPKEIPPRCPMHGDDPAPHLTQSGDYATIHRHTNTLTWQSGEHIFCPAKTCRSNAGTPRGWPIANWRLLDRLIAAEEQRQWLRDWLTLEDPEPPHRPCHPAITEYQRDYLVAHCHDWLHAKATLKAETAVTRSG